MEGQMRSPAPEVGEGRARVSKSPDRKRKLWLWLVWMSKEFSPSWSGKVYIHLDRVEDEQA